MQVDLTIFRELLKHYPHSPYLVLWRAWELSALDQLMKKWCVSRDGWVDFGSGAGQVAEILLEKPQMALEMDSGLCRDAHFRGNYSMVVQSDLTSIPLDKDSFRFALCNCVLEHIPDGEKALGEMARVLTPNGLLFITVPSCYFGESDWIKPKLAKLNISLQHHHYFDEEKLVQWGNETGLELQETMEYMPISQLRRWFRWRCLERAIGAKSWLVWKVLVKSSIRPQLTRLLESTNKDQGIAMAAVFRKKL